MRIDLGDDEVPEIGLIALIDCIFFLLMFFRVAKSFKQQNTQRKTKDLPIILPSATATLVAAQARPDPLVIGVDAQGGLSVDGDKRAAHQHIVHVLDLCQFEGLTQVAMRTRP
jgi:biopolymer transport protein ExbD